METRIPYDEMACRLSAIVAATEGMAPTGDHWPALIHALATGHAGICWACSKPRSSWPCESCGAPREQEGSP